MVKPVISVRNLGKRYSIGAQQVSSYRTLRETITDGVRGAVTGAGRLVGIGGDAPPVGKSEQVWALRDVSFDIEPGEVVGIIGRNGAGKSTLLKILSRITDPTVGEGELHGRVGSLLEVGTGFHPELTGRENIYLNGAILGMTRQEVERKFDAIVAFSEIGRFLDTPVKRYSSGMYVRLAFAVAAHLEPEILLVDEVLAVGDATYQRRCVDRMAELARSGLTVLFVSHNMDLIPRLCQRAIVLQHGQLQMEGPAAEMVAKYLRQQLADTTDEDMTNKPRTGDGRARFRRCRLLDPHGQPAMTHVCGDDLIVRVEIETKQEISNTALAVVLRTLGGSRIVSSWTREIDYSVDLRPGTQVFQCRFKNLRLRPGHTLCLMLWMEANGVMDSIEDAHIIQGVAGPESLWVSPDQYQGVVVCDYDYEKVEEF